jgi:hypothetical protein
MFEEKNEIAIVAFEGCRYSLFYPRGILVMIPL